LKIKKIFFFNKRIFLSFAHFFKARADTKLATSRRGLVTFLAKNDIENVNKCLEIFFKQNSDEVSQNLFNYDKD